MKFAYFGLLILILVARTQAQPSVVWQRTFGGGALDEGRTAVRTANGSFVIAGITRSYGSGGSDIYLVKISSAGNLIWQRTFGGHADESNEWVAIRETSDGGFIIGTETSSFGNGSYDFYLIRTDPEGNVLWTHTYGGSGTERARDMKQIENNGFIIVGYSTTFTHGGYADFYIVKTDQQGNIIWTRNYGGNGVQDAHSVSVLKDGSYLVAGYTTSYGAGQSDLWLLKISSDGNLLWSHTYGGPLNEGISEYTRVHELADRNIILAGFTQSYGQGGKDAFLVKTDSMGTVLWTNTFGGVGNDNARDVVATSDGGFALAGYTYSQGQGGNFFVNKANNSGAQVWSANFGGTAQDIAYSIMVIPGGYLVVGTTYSYGSGGGDMWVLKLTTQVQPRRRRGQGSFTETPYPDESVNVPTELVVSEGYPNPFYPIAGFDYEIPQSGEVKITLYNVLGEKEFTESFVSRSGSQHYTINAEKISPKLSSGTHLIRFEYADQIQTRKVIFLK